MPSLFYLAVIRKAKRRYQSRMRRLRTPIAYHDRGTTPLNELSNGQGNPDLSRPYADVFRQHSEFIGDISCRFNAHSPYLRCAVNPSGPCENCSYYDPKK